MDYSITITSHNNCGSATECTGSMVAVKGYNLGVYVVYIIPLYINVTVYASVGMLQ